MPFKATAKRVATLVLFQSCAIVFGDKKNEKRMKKHGFKELHLWKKKPSEKNILRSIRIYRSVLK